MFKNLAVLIAYTVLIKANLFALVLARAYKLTLYLLIVGSDFRSLAVGESK